MTLPLLGSVQIFRFLNKICSEVVHPGKGTLDSIKDGIDEALQKEKHSEEVSHSLRVSEIHI
jgi:hypothetical protein